MIIIDSDKKFEDLVENNTNIQYVIIDVFKNSCTPCKRFAKYYHQLEKDFKLVKNMLFIKLDVGKPYKVGELIDIFNIKSLPTFIICDIKSDKIVLNQSKLINKPNDGDILEQTYKFLKNNLNKICQPTSGTVHFGK